MGNPVGEERRKYRRIGTDQVISFAPVDTRDLLGVSRDLSSGGMIDPLTLDVGLEFVEIDPEAVEMLDDVAAPEAS